MTGPAYLVCSSFTATPLAAGLQAAVGEDPAGATVCFATPGQMDEALLAPKRFAPQAELRGLVVLLRLEDWLRSHREALLASPAPSGAIRRLLQARSEELVAQLAACAAGGLPIVFAVCPSRGWVATKLKAEALCQTYSGAVRAMVQARAGARLFDWERFAAGAAVKDADFDSVSDRIGQLPFGPRLYEALARALGAELLALGPAAERPAAGGEDPTASLARFFAGLKGRLALLPAGAGDVEEVAALAQAGTHFRTTLEKRPVERWRALLAQPDLQVLLVDYEDRLGSHPRCGYAVLRTGEGRLRVEELVLTCPVMGRQLEHALLVALARRAAEVGPGGLVVPCPDDPATQLARAFLTAVAQRASDSAPAAAEGLRLPPRDAERAVLALALAPDAVAATAASAWEKVVARPSVA